MHPSPSKVLLIRQVIWRLLGLGHFWERWPPACSALRAQWTCAKALFFVRRLGIARLHLVHVGTSPWTENVKFDIRCKAFCDYTSHYRIEFLLKICARGQILIYSFCYFLLSFEKLCVVWDHGLVVFFCFWYSMLQWAVCVMERPSNPRYWTVETIPLNEPLQSSMPHGRGSLRPGIYRHIHTEYMYQGFPKNKNDMCIIIM